MMYSYFYWCHSYMGCYRKLFKNWPWPNTLKMFFFLRSIGNIIWIIRQSPYRFKRIILRNMKHIYLFLLIFLLSFFIGKKKQKSFFFDYVTQLIDLMTVLSGLYNIISMQTSKCHSVDSDTYENKIEWIPFICIIRILIHVHFLL